MEPTHYPDNLMLTIDQVAQITGVRKCTLRYWEKAFTDYLKPARTPTNRREYSKVDLNQIAVIRQLLEQEHLTARGVRLRLERIWPTTA